MKQLVLSYLVLLLIPDWVRADIVTESAWARPNPPVVSTGAVYMTIHNTGPVADRLLLISGEVAATIELHETSHAQGITKMRHLAEGIEVAAGGKIELEPGGLHAMLQGLKQPLRSGNSFTLILHFAQAGDIPVEVTVKEP